MVGFRKESEAYWEKYTVSEKFPERFEIKIPIAIVEITALGESKKEKRVNDGLLRMAWGLGAEDIDYVMSGRLLTQPEDSDLERIQKASDAFREELRSTNDFLFNEIPEFLEMCGAPNSKRALVDSWAADRDMKTGSFDYSPLDEDDDLLRRISGKLKKKSSQVSGYDFPGLIAVYCSSFTNDGARIDTRCKHLSKELQKYPSIIGLVIFGSMWRESRNVYFKQPTHDYIEVDGAAFEVEEWLIIPNPSFRISSSNSLIVELREALAGESILRTE